jgi:hypothetical protein
MYHHHLRSRVPLNPVHNIIYSDTTLNGPAHDNQILGDLFLCGLGDRVALSRHPGSQQSWPGGRAEFLFSHWSASMLAGIIVDIL